MANIDIHALVSLWSRTGCVEGRLVRTGEGKWAFVLFLLAGLAGRPLVISIVI